MKNELLLDEEKICFSCKEDPKLCGNTRIRCAYMIATARTPSLRNHVPDKQHSCGKKPVDDLFGEWYNR